MNVPTGLFYTKEHEWVNIEGKKVTMGIDDYAQSSLGDITFIELPKVGDVCEQFKQFATVESVKAASDVYAPLSGKIIKVNEEVQNSPEIVNQSPYENGWFVVIELSDEKEKDNLMDSTAYQKYLEENKE
ncbi:MAG: glycine cleavage system protein GcvH [PVC group bacterium]|nr:glycine cleavage system protein GcvH [PVC group bacterium]